MMNSAYQKVIDVGHTDSRQSEYIQSQEYHRDALVLLDYYQYREFTLSFPSASTLESRRLWEEIGAVFDDNQNIQMTGYGGTPCKILVWETPETITKLQQLINSHDSTPTNILNFPEDINAEDVLSYVGQWAVEGDICYIITHIPNQGLKIDTLTNDPNDTIQVVTKNMRWEDHKIKFDTFYYFSRREEFKTR